MQRSWDRGSSISHVQVSWLVLDASLTSLGGCFWPRFPPRGFLHLAGGRQLKAKGFFHKSATSKFPLSQYFSAVPGFSIIQSQKFWNKFQLSSPCLCSISKYHHNFCTGLSSSLVRFSPFLWVNLSSFEFQPVPTTSNLMQLFPD